MYTNWILGKRKRLPDLRFQGIKIKPPNKIPKMSATTAIIISQIQLSLYCWTHLHTRKEKFKMPIKQFKKYATFFHCVIRCCVWQLRKCEKLKRRSEVWERDWPVSFQILSISPATHAVGILRPQRPWVTCYSILMGGVGWGSIASNPGPSLAGLGPLTISLSLLVVAH